MNLMELIRMRWTGTVPLIVKSGRGVNTLDEIVKAMKAITSKKKKTDEDLEELARLEWRSGLYFDKYIGPHDHEQGDGAIMPGYCIDAALVSAAKLSRRGTDVKRGVMIVENHVKIEYKGPRDPDKMWESRKFADIRAVRNQQARVMRCRPIFNEWAIEFTINFSPEVFNQSDIIAIAETAGRLTGLCDYRPRYGRFAIEVLEAANV